MLNLDEIRNQLQKAGIAKLDEFVASEEARFACSKIRALAERHGLLADGRWITSQDRFAVPKAFRRALAQLQRDSVTKITATTATTGYHRIDGANDDDVQAAQEAP